MPEPYLFGQMGEGDELESLTVIIPRSKSDDIRAEIARGRQAFPVRATGKLCHRSHITDIRGLKAQLDQWGKSFDLCLMIFEHVPTHCVIPVTDDLKLYSGYLWECVMPKAFAVFKDGELQSPDLSDTFFLWEHTNLAAPDAIK